MYQSTLEEDVVAVSCSRSQLRPVAVRDTEGVGYLTCAGGIAGVYSFFSAQCVGVSAGGISIVTFE